jgi:hypothetical protein
MQNRMSKTGFRPREPSRMHGIGTASVLFSYVYEIAEPPLPRYLKERIISR